MSESSYEYEVVEETTDIINITKKTGESEKQKIESVQGEGEVIQKVSSLDLHYSFKDLEKFQLEEEAEEIEEIYEQIIEEEEDSEENIIL